jgi:hypothetical protein
MRHVLTLALIALISTPAAALAQAAGITSGQWPQYPPIAPPRPPYQPPIRLGPPPPLTEAEWGRRLLQSREQASRCLKIGAFSGGMAAAGVAAAINNPVTPSPQDIATGVSGKGQTLAHVVGVATVLGGSLAFLTSARCSSYSEQTARELEIEGRRRGFGPPQLPVMTHQEWVARVANARADASVGKWMTLTGSVAMLAAGAAIRNYRPYPDQRGAARLGPGIGVFVIGYGATLVGATIWTTNAAEARGLARRQPPPGTLVSITPTVRGLRIGAVLKF